MGFKEPIRTARLRFEDNDYDGAEVICRLNVPMSTFFAMQRGADSDDPRQVETVLRDFGDNILQEWNVTDQDDEPLPANGDGFARVSPAFAVVILRAWIEAMTEVPRPLVEQSVNGATLAAASVPMGHE